MNLKPFISMENKRIFRLLISINFGRVNGFCNVYGTKKVLNIDLAFIKVLSYTMSCCFYKRLIKGTVRKE